MNRPIITDHDNTARTIRTNCTQPVITPRGGRKMKGSDLVTAIITIYEKKDYETE